MAYNDDKAPEPQYTVQVRVVEVIQSYTVVRSGSPVRVDRQTDDLVNITVRADSEDDAIGKAIAQLETARVN
jgi:hypothetical protein